MYGSIVKGQSVRADWLCETCSWFIYLWYNYAEQWIFVRKIFNICKPDVDENKWRVWSFKIKIRGDRAKDKSEKRSAASSHRVITRLFRRQSDSDEAEKQVNPGDYSLFTAARSHRKFKFTSTGAPQGSVRGGNAVLLTPPACSDLFLLDISRRKWHAFSGGSSYKRVSSVI